jgi:hypothetical protein
MKQLPKGLSITNIKTYKVAKLYNTNIVEIDLSTGLISLNSGTWKTKHTKKCMNLVLSQYGAQVIQKDFNWYVITKDNKKQAFFDGIQVSI